MESSGRVSGDIPKLYIQYYYEPTILFHPPIYRYPVYGSSLGGTVVLVASETRTAAYGSAYWYVIDNMLPNPLGPGSEDWSYTSVLGLVAGQVVVVAGAMVVVVGAIEYADVWLVVESAAERRLMAG
jgi:hypothetical protein